MSDEVRRLVDAMLAGAGERMRDLADSLLGTASPANADAYARACVHDMAMGYDTMESASANSGARVNGVRVGELVKRSRAHFLRWRETNWNAAGGDLARNPGLRDQLSLYGACAVVLHQAGIKGDWLPPPELGGGVLRRGAGPQPPPRPAPDVDRSKLVLAALVLVYLARRGRRRG